MLVAGALFVHAVANVTSHIACGTRADLCHTKARVAEVWAYGLGVRTPFGIGVAALLEGLCAGRRALAPYAPFAEARVRFPVAAALSSEILCAGVACVSDRASALLEGAVRDALEDATGARDLEGLAGLVSPSRVALAAGTSSSGIGPFCAALAGEAPGGEGARYASAAHAVARRIGIAGPVLVICSVCASGALAIAEAAEMVERGLVDLAIAAGFDPLEPFVAAGFDSLGALTDVPRPFRAGRRGLALGEGAAAVVLARPAALTRSPRGKVLGWGRSADAHHLTAPDPTGAGVALAIERALARAGLSREAVSAVNAHGTGTPFNDAMESAALTRVFGSGAGGIPVYTLKGNIGHTLGAAGAIEAVASFAAMEARVLPPTLTSGERDPRCELDLVEGAPRNSDAAVTLKLSSAFGGTNCALVLGAARG